MSIQIYWKFYHHQKKKKKKKKIQIKSCDIFHISAQNIDYGYPLEPSPPLDEAVITNTHKQK